MLKKGDKVRIIGSGIVKDFTEATIVGNNSNICEELGLPMLIQLDNGYCHYIDKLYLFKETHWIYKLIKLFKRKKYAEYQRTNKTGNEV